MSHRTPTDILVLHAVRILGYAETDRIAARFALPVGLAAEHLLDAEARGWVTHIAFAGDSGWSLTEAGKVHGERLLAAELDRCGTRAVVVRVHRDFLPHNVAVADSCTAWQLAEIGLGEATVTIGETISRLGTAADALAELEARLVAGMDRFAGYHQRFAGAVERAGTEPAWITATDRDSCHRVWFEFHEDLIASLGLTR
ncbi:hypothetical protein [Rhodococcus wratislaviensis]|uniref:Uncharacterized protein n=1 Tax=Rhodococcus wratislaviensis NBRC 100605 TaxID=1219028 RepID=X0Q3D9_RHOWR|nr:hypothetical protein [Rhodococcus wratislaviensis]GAF50794.1 hypothetical protein RW1_095_04190 [Rhodococcus wratislaviensis NBRC 100605]